MHACDSLWGAGHDDTPLLEGDASTDMLQDGGQVKDHVVGIVVLPNLAVDPRLERQALRVLD